MKKELSALLDKAFQIARDYFENELGELHFDLTYSFAIANRYVTTHAFTEDGGFMYLCIDTETGEVISK